MNTRVDVGGILEISERQRAVRIFRQPVRVEKDEFLQLLDAAYAVLGMFPDLFARDEEHSRPRILKDESDLFDSLRCVDGHIDGAEAKDGKIGKRPFGSILGDDRNAVAGLYAKGRQTHCD